MEFAAKTVEEIIVDLSAQKKARGISYQSIADACGVSQSTIIRIFKGEVEPSYTQLQQIAAAVQYKPAREEQIPSDFTKDAYIAHLQEAIRTQNAEKERQVQQLQAHYNMLRRQDRRTIRNLCIILALLVSAFIFWLIIDVTHPNIGWIQREVSYGGISQSVLWDIPSLMLVLRSHI